MIPCFEGSGIYNILFTGCASFRGLSLAGEYSLFSLHVMVPPSTSFRRGRNIRSQSQSFQASSKFVRKRKAGRNFQYKLRENAGALRCQDYLTSGFLNIDGLSDAKLADVQKFATEVKPDLFVILETKRR